ncbi:hypothetical protein H7J87_27360 [Mycolicibacterium wolinskyi]|uniref:Uncharacterized protein n=1 Tax=Mycolicibacterium wolinskyi TaxID=59750 RepID=A0A1X2F4H2_9MYCO|nr:MULTISPECIES: hypothetical protein [Mycolicibacterium]MCV7289051.1 hypothetical protein [Mycolicibacterium wolinskyi]MCV7296478.1 hypothetical protein [Mycolicibacterium goodii]ORX13315.1 hypothetical protein AWC31_01955 [Mycolicibacterium wolinskyi]
MWSTVVVSVRVIHDHRGLVADGRRDGVWMVYRMIMRRRLPLTYDRQHPARNRRYDHESQQ